jgi:Gas vesicle synthesis protein GvpL/GvpF
MAAANSEPKYVYGIVGADASAPAARGIAGAPLELLADGGLAALASTAPGEFLEAGREELLTHSRVLEAALEKATVLPMRFGVVMTDADTVREQLLGPHREELTAQLREFEGKVEISLKGLYDEGAILREVVAEDREVARLREAIRDKPADATYYERIQLGELVAAALTAKQEADASAIVEALVPHAVAVEVGEPVHERMALNASFLVERSSLPEFDRAVDALGRAQAGRVRLKYTGPLPPHSFVELGVAA